MIAGIIWMNKNFLSSYFRGLNPGQDEIDEMIEETDRDNSGAIDFRLIFKRLVLANVLPL